MPLATYKDLCIDAVDAAALGRFWAGVLGLELELLDDGDARLTGPTPQHTVWLNTVPEPVTVKQRVHLDVHALDVADVIALGATPEDLDSFRWKILRDPEGGELCVFPRAELPEQRLMEIVVACAEPIALTAWWHALLGGVVRHSDDGAWAWLEEIPGAPFEALVFVPVPEPKTVKNRIHLDVVTDDLEAVVASGARVLLPEADGRVWTVLADPEGNELCAFLPGP